MTAVFKGELSRTYADPVDDAQSLAIILRIVSARLQELPFARVGGIMIGFSRAERRSIRRALGSLEVLEAAVRFIKAEDAEYWGYEIADCPVCTENGEVIDDYRSRSCAYCSDGRLVCVRNGVELADEGDIPF